MPGSTPRGSTTGGRPRRRPVLLQSLDPRPHAAGRARAGRAQAPAHRLRRAGADPERAQRHRRQVRALGLGADDYSPSRSGRELLARVRARLRRPVLQRSEIVTCGDLVIDTAGRSVTVRGERIDLTRVEFDLLAALARRPGRPSPDRGWSSTCWTLNVKEPSARWTSRVAPSQEARAADRAWRPSGGRLSPRARRHGMTLQRRLALTLVVSAVPLVAGWPGSAARSAGGRRADRAGDHAARAQALGRAAARATRPVFSRALRFRSASA